MITTNTFKVGRTSIELRVYVPWMKVAEIANHTEAAKDAVREALDQNGIQLEQMTLCSNRAGLHYAYNHCCRPTQPMTTGGGEWRVTMENIDATIARLKRAGWKESKGN